MTNSLNISSPLVEVLSLFEGQNIQTDWVEKINNGQIALVTGLVIKQTYKSECDLEQVMLKNNFGQIISLTNNSNFSLIEVECKNDKYQLKNPSRTNLFSIFRNADQINAPREIWISNLDNFEDTFREAISFNLSISCLYSRLNGEILLMNIVSTTIHKSYNHQPQSNQQAYNVKGCHPYDFACQQ